MTRNRKAVFDPSAIDDEIDDFFTAASPSELEIEVAAPPSAPAQTPKRRPASKLDPPSEHSTLSPTPVGDRTRSTASAVKRAPTPETARSLAPSSPPEVSIAPTVYQALRELTLRERRTDPSTSRPYGEVVLDAIDQSADLLALHWRAKPSSEGMTNSLFSRPAPKQKRRRHATPPARVPLAGIAAGDVQRLDELASDWSAGNRSILVERALRYYLGLDVAGE